MSVQYLGNFADNSTVYCMFNTFDSNDPSASVTITNLINTDVHIHKNDGLTQRNNAAGITVSVDFDGITGSHMLKIDTNDNTVVGFWVTGADYFVRIEGTTVDAATLNVVIAHFSIENRFADVNVTQLGGVVQSLTDLKDFADAGYDPATNKVQGVVLVDTTTSNSDMRGTNSAALASVCTEARLAELDAANLPTNVDSILTDTGTTLDTKINDIQGATFNTTTDSIEAIRNRGDSAWTTGAGGSDRLLMVDTTLATVASQTSFTLTAGSADDNAYNNCTAVIENVSTSTQKAVAIISNYTGASKTVTLKYDPAIFTMAATDKIYILAENALKSTAANRQLDVTTTGAAGVDWGNVENPTTAVDLSSTDIQLCDTATTLTNLPAITSNWLTAAGISSGALDGKGNWNLGKTGYSLTQTFPTNFSDLAITVTTGRVDVDAIAGIAQTGNDNGADIPAILVDTAVIGALGAGLTGIPWNAAWDAEVQSECADALIAYDSPTNAEMETRTPTATQLAYITAHAATAPPVTFTGGTTTSAIIGNVDGVAASAVDDYYKGRIFIFNAGTLNEQATDITSYTGATKTATITAVTTAVTSSHTAIMV